MLGKSSYLQIALAILLLPGPQAQAQVPAPTVPYTDDWFLSRPREEDLQRAKPQVAPFEHKADVDIPRIAGMVCGLAAMFASISIVKRNPRFFSGKLAWTQFALVFGSLPTFGFGCFELGDAAFRRVNLVKLHEEFKTLPLSERVEMKLLSELEHRFQESRAHPNAQGTALQKRMATSSGLDLEDQFKGMLWKIRNHWTPGQLQAEYPDFLAEADLRLLRYLHSVRLRETESKPLPNSVAPRLGLNDGPSTPAMSNAPRKVLPVPGKHAPTVPSRQTAGQGAK